MEPTSPLRYVDAERLDTPAGRLNDTVVVSPTDAKLGMLEGMIINPVMRQVCYYVVKARTAFRTHRYLLPATPARLESDRRALHVDVEADDLRQLPEAHPRSFMRFSEMDAVDAIFAPRARA